MRIALANQHKFLCCEGGGDQAGIIHANRSTVGAWETLTVEPQPDGTLALKSVNGKYLAAEGGGGSVVHANRDAVGGWEQWIPSAPLIDQATLTFRTKDGGQYLSVAPDPDRTVEAKATLPIIWTVTVVEADQPVPQPPTGNTSLTPLRVDGFHFANDAGRWFGVGATHFLLYQKYLDGGDQAIIPQLQQMKDLGFNFVRVIGMVASFSHWYPQEHPDYYDKIPAFLDLCASYGLYVYWTAFADTRVVMPNPLDQQTHWAKTCNALLLRPNRFLEKVNEDDQHDNHVDAHLPKPPGLLSCCGSNGGQPTANPPMPFPDWDFGDFHVRRDYPKTIPDMTTVQLRTGDTTDGRAHPVPIGQGEPPGFGETPGPHGRWIDPEHARELRYTAEGTAAFVVFHCDDGVMSNLFEPNQQACAKAFTGKESHA